MQPHPPSHVLLREAADWALALRYDAPTKAKREAFEQWRQQSPAHEAAWRKTQEVFDTFSQVNAGVGKDALKSLERKDGRRRTMRLLGALLVAAPAGALAWRELVYPRWSADVITATGERKSISLPDGSRLVLNTSSAVDIDFGPAERRIRLLKGEILITTRKDTSPVFRPFLVETAHGTVHALGTRFSVRQIDREVSRVSVFEEAVEVYSLDGSTRSLRAGMQLDFLASGPAETVAVDRSASLWEHGMLLAKNMRLEDVINEMARYRRGVLRCDPSVADLRVSGAISLADAEAGLQLLTHSLPLRVNRSTDYWVTVTSR